MLTFPIRTARLLLEPLRAGDREAFVAYRQDPDVARWQSWTPEYDASDADRLLAAQRDSLRSRSGAWMQIAVRERSTGALWGDVAVHALADQPDSYEIGVTIAPARQQTGIGTEAVRGLVDALFDQQRAHRVIAVTDARNPSAARLFARVGFRHEGRAVDADWFKGEWSSVDTWALLRHEHDARSER